MSTADIAVIIVALISGFAALASQRAAAKASVLNNSTSSRVEMEKEAYERARAMDVETINRQAARIKDLEEQVDELTEGNREQEVQIKMLRLRVSRLEGKGRVGENE